MAVCDNCGHKEMCSKYLATGGVNHCGNHTALKGKPTKDERMEAISTINRAIGVIEGVMLTTEHNVSEALGCAVEMLDDALKVVLNEDG